MFYTFIYTNLCNIYICIYIYIHTHTYIYTYIHVHIYNSMTQPTSLGKLIK